MGRTARPAWLAGSPSTTCICCHRGWRWCTRPRPQLGVDVSETIELTIYGVRCVSKCRQSSGGWYWCKQLGSKDSWDYCSPDKYTIYKEKCLNRCMTDGASYNWCKTATSWDYCSPKGSRS